MLALLVERFMRSNVNVRTVRFSAIKIDESHKKRNIIKLNSNKSLLGNIVATKHNYSRSWNYFILFHFGICVQLAWNFDL